MNGIPLEAFHDPAKIKAIWIIRVREAMERMKQRIGKTWPEGWDQVTEIDWLAYQEVEPAIAAQLILGGRAIAQLQTVTAELSSAAGAAVEFIDVPAKGKMN